MPIHNKKIVILLEDNYQELELWYPLLRFREEGFVVQLAASQAKKVYSSKLGYPATSEIAIKNVVLDEVDAIVIPGGYAPDRMRSDDNLLMLVSNAHAKNKLIAAICHAGWVLVSAGILANKKATCYHSIKDDIINAGADYQDQAVVRDGNIITSRQPDDLPHFCKAIIAALNEVTVS